LIVDIAGKEAMTISFSRRLALVFGIFIPLGETARRYHQLDQLSVWPFWLDDILIGALLLYGAWRTGKDMRSGRRFLAAAWGFTCGMAYLSFFGQLGSLNEQDPAPLPSSWIAAIKGVGFALSILALVGSLKQSKEEGNEERVAQTRVTGA
jgi:hypothetical protein